AGGLPVRGLSEAGGAAEPAGADGGTAADPHVLAAVGSGGGKADFGKGKGGGIGPLRTCFRRLPPDLLSPSSPDLIRGSEARGGLCAGDVPAPRPCDLRRSTGRSDPRVKPEDDEEGRVVRPSRGTQSPLSTHCRHSS